MSFTFDPTALLRNGIFYINTSELVRVSEEVVEIARKELVDFGPVIYLDVNSRIVIDEGSSQFYLTSMLDDGTNIVMTGQDEALKYFNGTNNGFLIYNWTGYPDKDKFDDVALVSLIQKILRLKNSEYDKDIDPLPFGLIIVGDVEMPQWIPDAVVTPEVELPNSDARKAIIERLIVRDVQFVSEHAQLDDLVFSTSGITKAQIYNVWNESRNSGVITTEDVRSRRNAAIASRLSSSVELVDSKKSFADIGGLDTAKAVMERVAWITSNRKLADEAGLDMVNKILLLGVPGTGKSLFAQAVAGSMGYDLAKCGVGRVLDKWVGNSEKNMREMISTLIALTPVVAWIDEFGRDAAEGQNTDGGTTNRVQGEFLSALADMPDDLFIMAAANDISAIAPETLRSGRFDMLMFVGFPTHAERKEIWNIHTGGKLNSDILNLLATATESFTGAEIEALVKRTAFDVLPQRLKDDPTYAIRPSDYIARRDSLKARMYIRKRAEMLEMYDKAQFECEWASMAQYAEREAVTSSRYGSVDLRSLHAKAESLQASVL